MKKIHLSSNVCQPIKNIPKLKIHLFHESKGITLPKTTPFSKEGLFKAKFDRFFALSTDNIPKKKSVTTPSRVSLVDS